jgi:EAL domain-containing protein (putative c-di-GMP-specific phosphodiesterase class I)/DNA-binding response OmpR family regulator
MTQSAPQQPQIADAHLERAHEELRAHATSLVQAWDKLNSSRWNAAHGRGLQLAAKQLVRACERLRLSLTRKAGELETFIRVFVDTSLTPNNDQLRTLSALVSTLASTVLALDMVSANAPLAASRRALPPSADTPATHSITATTAAAAGAAAHAPAPLVHVGTPPQVRVRRTVQEVLIVLIGAGDAFGIDLAPAFTEHGFAVRSFARPEDAYGLLLSSVPRAIVISAANGNAIAALRGLAKPRGDLQENHREPTLAVVTPRQDLGRRLAAMRQGVKYFEPPIDPLAMLVAITSDMVAPGSPSRVLLVDGDRARGLQAATWLKDAGYTVRLCQGSEDALSAVASFKPQIAVIDADMRGAESMRLVNGLRDDPTSSEIPVVLVASSRELALREQAIAGGADEYLLKPLKPRHLVSVIESRLKRSQRFAPRRGIARDESTGLYPRREFIERADAARGQSGAVMLYLVLDEHESLRKQLGISGQSRLDIAVGQALKENLRAEDMPSLYQDCRYLVLLRRSDRAAALASAESLRESLARRRIQIGDHEVSLKASLGLANLDGDSADIGVQNAEAAALAAMHLGGNRSMWFEARSASLIPAERDAQLRGLLQSSRFGQHMEIRGAALIPLRGRVPGQYELVLGWRPGGNGQPAATQDDLTRVAREVGCVREFDRFIVGEALTVRADLLKRGRQVRLIVELSPWALDDGDFAACLEQLLRDRRQSGTGVALTLPAAVLAERLDALVAFSQQLKPLAIRVGLKDVGRDMALVHRLRGVPVDYLRLSPELSTATATSERAMELLAALIRRAHQSGTMVIGSSIDSREQAQQLQLAGIDYIESPTLAPPTAQFDFDFARWMADQRQAS